MSTALALAAVAAFAAAFAVVFRTDPALYGTRRYEVTVHTLMLIGIGLAFAAHWASP